MTLTFLLTLNVFESKLVFCRRCGNRLKKRFNRDLENYWNALPMMKRGAEMLVPMKRGIVYPYFTGNYKLGKWFSPEKRDTTSNDFDDYPSDDSGIAKRHQND